MTKKKRYNYIKKKIARGTWPCILTMLLALGLLLATLALSVHFQGQGPMLLGALGFSSIVMSILSIYWPSTTARKITYRSASAASSLSAYCWSGSFSSPLA